MQKNFNKLEDAINKLNQEVILGGLRTPVPTVALARYLPGPDEEYMESFLLGHYNISSPVCMVPITSFHVVAQIPCLSIPGNTKGIQ